MNIWHRCMKGCVHDLQSPASCSVCFSLSRNISVDVWIVCEKILAVHRSLHSVHKKYKQILNIWHILLCLLSYFNILFMCLKTFLLLLLGLPVFTDLPSPGVFLFARSVSSLWFVFSISYHMCFWHLFLLACVSLFLFFYWPRLR